MTVTIKNIIPRQQASAVQTTHYTASGCKAIIDKFTATNTSAAIVTLSVHLVASGATAGVSNMVMKTRAIQPGEAYLCPELVGQTLEPGGFISAIASADLGLTLSASGREVT